MDFDICFLKLKISNNFIKNILSLSVVRLIFFWKFQWNVIGTVSGTNGFMFKGNMSIYISRN